MKYFYAVIISLISIQLYIAEEFVQISESAKLKWAPHEINVNCPLFVFARNGKFNINKQIFKSLF